LALPDAHEQAPPPHVEPGFTVAQDFPQAPQFEESLSTSVHKVPQSSGFGPALSQAHTPLLQVAPGLAVPQSFPHVPQWAGSAWRLTHSGEAPGHALAVRSQAHTPAEQVPRPQAWLHSPQWFASVATSTQTAPHFC
jgi:hypothetical protein